MRRRDFITLLGGVAVSRPLTAWAQQAAKLPTIGFLGASSLSAIERSLPALVQRLNELGWIEGRSVVIVYRWAAGRNERMAELAAEFVRMNVDIIVTHGTAAVIATKQATSIIPIVFAAAGDPVATGLVTSLARPGGNVTGLSLQQTDTGAKRLELLRQVVPNLQRLAIIANLDSPGRSQKRSKFRQRRRHSASKLLRLESGEPKISLLHWKRQRAQPMPFLLLLTPCSRLIGWVLTF
jgi:putative ABC transport system substrate-binding protein